MIQKSVITNTSRIVELRQMGTVFRIVVLHAVWSDVEIWYEHTLEAAEARFQRLVAINTRKPRTPQRVTFTAPYVDEPRNQISGYPYETIMTKRWDKEKDIFGEGDWGDRSFDLLDFE